MTHRQIFIDKRQLEVKEKKDNRLLEVKKHQGEHQECSRELKGESGSQTKHKQPALVIASWIVRKVTVCARGTFPVMTQVQKQGTVCKYMSSIISPKHDSTSEDRDISLNKTQENTQNITIL